MSILLGVSMLLGIENHEGHYIPKSGDLKAFMGLHYKAAVIAPTGRAKAGYLATIAGLYSYSVEMTWPMQPFDCTVIKEICAEDYQCTWQKMKYRLVQNSSIGENNSVYSMQYAYRSPFDRVTRSSIYFDECGGFQAHNVEAKGLVQVS